ncbi:MAG TPA: dTDP-4-dehydrorhamnose 3,5-epimerase [Pyrinomonadaceae bacterium]|nr:dTDP-4-dehydrorhamnose 3,5-epimerase [Pyrinomonadaceae bacterium]
MGIIFRETKLKGAFVIDPQRFEDERGFLARSFSAKEFEDHGLNPRIAECNISFSRKRYTVRGMHFQKPPHAQAKLVRCSKGAIYDVIIDLRPESPTFKQWIGEELTAENRRMLYVPEGFAHGFQTLEENTEVFYQISEFYTPQSEAGVRWNDPAFAIRWPASDGVTINDRDRNYPDFKS